MKFDAAGFRLKQEEEERELLQSMDPKIREKIENDAKLNRMYRVIK